MFHILSTFVILVTLTAISFGQDSSNCGDFTVTGPPGVVVLQRFEAKFSPPVDPSRYTIKWTVDNGKILSGQGTLVLQALGNDDGTTIRATAEVTGLGVCNRTASDTGVVCDCVEPILIDEFGTFPDDELQVRLENLLNNLRSDPTATGFVLAYGPIEVVAQFMHRARKLLPKRDEPWQLLFKNAGDEDELRVRIWIVPAGADASQID